MTVPSLLRPLPGVSSRRVAPRAAAFTLLELLLAVAIFGVVSATVGTIFYTSVSAWRTGTAAADAMHHIDAVSEQAVSALRSAYYPESEAPLDKYGFCHENDGDEMPDCHDKISWVKVGNSLVGEDASYAGVPHRVELFIMDESDGPDGPGLYVRAWRLDGQEEDFNPEEEVDPVLISSAVVGLDCKMIDRDTPVDITSDEPFTWLEEWETTNRIPERVLFSIAVAPAEESDLEPLVIQRYVEIPMAALSWNPVVTSKKSDKDRGTRGDTSGDGNEVRNTGGYIGGSSTRGSSSRTRTSGPSARGSGASGDSSRFSGSRAADARSSGPARSTGGRSQNDSGANPSGGRSSDASRMSGGTFRPASQGGTP